MNDRIVLTVPPDEALHSVVTLVLGGVGTRLDLPYERTDELQLAALSALEAGDGREVSLEVEAGDDALVVTLGPLRQEARDDAGLARVLSRLVDDVQHETRDGADWLTMRVRRPQPAG
jgi:hypothetical protein